MLGVKTKTHQYIGITYNGTGVSIKKLTRHKIDAVPLGMCGSFRVQSIAEVDFLKARIRILYKVTRY